MQHQKINAGIVIALAILFSIFSIALFGRVSFSFPLLSILLLSFLVTKGAVIIWTAVVGLSFEMVSPYPAFTYLFSLLATVIILRICMHYYLSHRTILSAAVAGVLGMVIFAISLQALSRVSGFFTDGWIPAFDRSFALALAEQTVVMALGLAIVLAAVRHFSPGLRGVIINRGIYH